MNFTEDQLARLAAPPSQTEREKMENAERAIKKAVAASDKLKARNVRVFAQGSYRNRVNVRADSDVDIAVLCSDTIFWRGPDGLTLEKLGLKPATYRFETFRTELHEALISFFGQNAVKNGDKAFDIKANTYRVDADVAPFFRHRRYGASGEYLEGVEMRTRANERIINWPDQHYDNSVGKNDRTSRSFKGCVRILKSLRYEMLRNNISSADGTSSFLMECLIWNVPDAYFTASTWTKRMRNAMAFLFNNTMSDETCSEWREVSELKHLFSDQQAWTWHGTHEFLSDCWDYAGFE